MIGRYLQQTKRFGNVGSLLKVTKLSLETLNQVINFQESFSFLILTIDCRIVV